MSAQHAGTRPRTIVSLTLALGLGLSLGLGTVPAGTAASGRAEPAGPALSAAIPHSVLLPIRRSEAALERATTHIRRHHPVKAVHSLRGTRIELTSAHRAGMRQIGAPPTDPENNDPPGPPAVLAVLGLEHRVSVDVVQLFDRRKGPKVVHALRGTLRITHLRRDAILDKVIALPPEGDGADYADGMADTLGRYGQEVRLLKAALDTYRLTASGRAGLTHALHRTQLTKAKVNRAYGGGE